MKTYRITYYVGSFVSESDKREVQNRELPKEHNKFVFAYKFYDEDEDHNQHNTTGLMYIDGEKFDLDRVKREVPDSRILQSNMKNNNFEYVVRTRHGQFMQFNNEDIIIRSHEDILEDELFNL